jgi:hypothetical protein
MVSEANPGRFRLRREAGAQAGGIGHDAQAIVRAFRVDETREVRSDTETSFAKPGDWIVTTAKGSQIALPDALFRSMYEPARDEEA